MALTYRTSGDWGPGKGSNLTPAEVDGNFHDLDSRIVGIEENPPVGVGIASVVANGRILTITLTNSATYDFTLPVATIAWGGEWAPSTLYPELTTFFVKGSGLYLTLQEYESGTEFDPLVATTEGPVLRYLFGIPGLNSVNVINLYDDHVDIEDIHAGAYLRFEAEPATELSEPQTYGVGPNDLPIGTIISLRRATDRPVEVIGDGGVVINSPETTRLRANGSAGTLVKVGDLEWDLAGDLEIG